MKAIQTQGESASKTPCCARWSQFLRAYTIICGAAMVMMGIFIIILAGINVSDATDTCGDGRYFTDGNDEGTCKLAVDQAVSFISMAIFVIFFAFLTIAAELPVARGCIARHFGFFCSRVGKGLYLLFCGAILACLGRYFDDTEASKDAGGADALAPFVVGMMFVGDGVLQLVCACCLPSDHSRAEFLLWVRRPPDSPAVRSAGQVEVIVEGEEGKTTEESPDAEAPAAEGEAAATKEESSHNPFKAKSSGGAAGEEESSHNPFKKKPSASSESGGEEQADEEAASATAS